MAAISFLPKDIHGRYKAIFVVGTPAGWPGYFGALEYVNGYMNESFFMSDSSATIENVHQLQSMPNAYVILLACM